MAIQAFLNTSVLTVGYIYQFNLDAINYYCLFFQLEITHTFIFGHHNNKFHCSLSCMTSSEIQCDEVNSKTSRKKNG